MKNNPGNLHIRKRYFLLLACITSLLLLAGGFILYMAGADSIRNDKKDEIKSIADLKVGQITQWLKERKDDALTNSSSPFFSNEIRLYLNNRNDLNRKNEIIQKLSQIKNNYGYSAVFLFIPNGKLLVSTEPENYMIDSVTSAFVFKIVKNKQIKFSDFYYCKTHHEVHLDIMAPVMESNHKLAAVLVLRTNPQNYLYPLIQTWPVLSKTAETLIGRKDGDSVVFLNELRHKKNTTLRLRIPLTAIDVPAVQAAFRRSGVFEGRDYRGEKVLSYIEPIPGTDWFMIAKVDKKEIYSELYFRAIFISLFTVILIIMVGIGFFLIYNTQQKNILQELLDNEIELRKSQEETKTVLYSIGDAVITTDVNGIINRMNPVAEQLTGWTEAEGKGKTVNEVFRIINEDTRQSVDNPYNRVLLEGMITGLANHTLLISKNGKVIPIADSGAPVKNEDGKITGVVLVFRDQTEERASRNAILEREENFRNLFEHSPTGKSMTGIDGSLRVNKAFCDIVGYSEDELSKKNWMELSYPDDIPKTNELIKSMLNGEKSQVRFEKRYIHKNGNIVWTDASTYLQRDNEGKPKFYISNIIDITERKKAEEEIHKLNAELEEHISKRTAQLEAANKDLEAFSYSVSHDLRAPLRHINGYVDLLTERFHDILTEKGRHYLENIADSAHQMGNLIDDLLQFSRTGRQEMLESSFDMNKLLKEVLQTIKDETTGREIKWINAKLPYVYGDSALLRLVWYNLLANAVKYTRTKEKTRIETGYLEDKHEFVFFVRDNGVGFDMQYAHKLFGVFQRLHSSAEFEGTGIGLANVRRIILKHGGRTWAEAELNNGAAFYFTIPKNREENP